MGEKVRLEGKNFQRVQVEHGGVKLLMETRTTQAEPS